VVADRSGIELEYEIEFVGDWDAAGGWGTPSSDLQGGAA